MDQANLQVNGNQVINSTDKTIEIPFNFTVNTNNRTGYTATLSAETDNTALTNTTSTVGAKINSVNTNLSLNNLPNNTWGYKFGYPRITRRFQHFLRQRKFSRQQGRQMAMNRIS